jgi:hypothetical protein
MRSPFRPGILIGMTQPALTPKWLSGELDRKRLPAQVREVVLAGDPDTYFVSLQALLRQDPAPRVIANVLELLWLISLKRKFEYRQQVFSLARSYLDQPDPRLRSAAAMTVARLAGVWVMHKRGGLGFETRFPEMDRQVFDPEFRRALLKTISLGLPRVEADYVTMVLGWLDAHSSYEASMQEALKTIRSHAAETYVGTGAPDPAIHAAEAALGVRFPLAYRTFLRELGVTLWPREIYGIVESNSRYSNVVENTLSERTEVEPELPPHLVALSPDGWGNHYCLDPSSPSGDECPVVFWNHELGSDQTPKVVSAGFLAWLRSEIQKEESHAG